MNTIALDARSPDGPVADQWDTREFEVRLLTPSNRRKFRVIVLGSGPAGAPAARSLNGLGYQVQLLTECEAACPKEISIDFIALISRNYVAPQFTRRHLAGQGA